MMTGISHEIQEMLEVIGFNEFIKATPDNVGTLDNAALVASAAAAQTLRG